MSKTYQRIFDNNKRWVINKLNEIRIFSIRLLNFYNVLIFNSISLLNQSMNFPLAIPFTNKLIINKKPGKSEFKY